MELKLPDECIEINKSMKNDKYHIKRYFFKYGFIKHFFRNEIKMNKIIKKLKIHCVPIRHIRIRKRYALLYFKKQRTIKLKKISKEQGFYLFDKLLGILKKLHINKICHNDIKLTNILVTNKNRLMLIDYCLSTQFSNNYKKDLYSLTRMIYYFTKEIEVFNKLNYEDIDKYIKSYKELSYEFIHKRGIGSKKL